MNVKEAAQKLQKSEQFVRIGLQTGRLGGFESGFCEISRRILSG